MKNLKRLGVLTLACLALTACKKDEVNQTKESIIPSVYSEAPKTEDESEIGVSYDENEPYVDEGGVDEYMPQIGWEIGVVQDMIHGDKMLYKLTSQNIHEIDGVMTDMVMYVREKKGSSYLDKIDYEIFFKVNSGKFFCVNLGNCTINAKVGGKVMPLAYSDETSHNFNTIFIKGRGYFMDMMLKDNTLVIEANFLYNGNRQFMFDVSNFPGQIYKENPSEQQMKPKDNQ